MRIAYVDHATEVGGAEKSLLDLMSRLDRSRFEPILLCPPDAEWLDGADLAGVSVQPAFAAGGLPGRRRDQLGNGLLANAIDLAASARPVISLYRSVRRWRPVLVHTNTLKAHMLGGAAASMARRPLIWHLRDLLGEGNARRLLIRAAERFRPRIIAISEAVRESLRGVKVDVSVIYNGIDPSDFGRRSNRPKVRAALGLTPDDVAVCAVGRLTPWKGHRELLRAFAQAVKHAPSARLVVAGEVAFWEEGYETELRALAAELGIQALVRWLGFRGDVPDILAACDVFALPSTDEPFGRVFVEAMASGLPVVGIRSGGVPEIVVEGETGLLVEAGDLDTLTAALVRLVRDEPLRNTMGSAGRSRAAACFDLSRAASRVQAVYEDVLVETQRKPAGRGREGRRGG